MLMIVIFTDGNRWLRILTCTTNRDALIKLEREMQNVTHVSGIGRYAENADIMVVNWKCPVTWNLMTS